MSCRALLGLVLAGLVFVAEPANGQPSRTWANAGNDWGTAANWLQGQVPTSTDGVLLPSLASGSAVSPSLAGNFSASFLTVLNNAGAGNVYSLNGTGQTLSLSSSSANTQVGTATQSPAAALTVNSGGTAATSTIAPLLKFGNGSFVYTLGGTTLAFAGGIGSITPGQGISFRTDGTSTVQFLAAADASLTGTVNLTATVSANGRYLLGADAALGSGNLTTGGGTGQSFSLIPFDPTGTNGIVRTVSNGAGATSVNLTGPSAGSITFGDSGSATNTLRFTGTTFLGPVATTGGTRTYTVNLNTDTTFGNPLLSNSALQFAGNTGLLASNATVAGTVQFQGTGRVEISGVVSNGGSSNAGSLLVGTGNGLTAVRLANAANTYTGTTNLQSGSLIVAANAPASGSGALGTPASGNETVTIGTAGGTITRYLVLDLAGGDIQYGRPTTVTTGPAVPPLTFLGVKGTNAQTNTGTFTSTAVGSVTPVINLGTAGSSNPVPLVLVANAAGSTAVFNSPIQRNPAGGGYTGTVYAQVNATLNGFGGSGTVQIGGTQSTTLNAQTGVGAGTFQVNAGTSWDTGRGFFVGGGTAVVNGSLTQNTAPTGSAPLGTVRVGANFTLPTPGNPTAPATVTDTNVGTLSGTGTIALPLSVASGATLTPGQAGAAPGVLTVNGPVSLEGGSNLRLTIASGSSPTGSGYNLGNSTTGAAGASNSRLTTTGANSLTLSSLNVVVDLTGVNLTQFQTYSFIVATGNNISPAGTGGPTQVTVGTFTFVGNSLPLSGDASLFVSADSSMVYLNFTPVPEPATVLAVAGLGLATVTRLRRRVG